MKKAVTVSLRTPADVLKAWELLDRRWQASQVLAQAERGNMLPLIRRLKSNALLTRQERDLIAALLARGVKRPAGRPPYRDDAKHIEIANYIALRRHQGAGREESVQDAVAEFDVTAVTARKAFADYGHEPPPEFEP